MLNNSNVLHCSVGASLYKLPCDYVIFNVNNMVYSNTDNNIIIQCPTDTHVVS